MAFFVLLLYIILAAPLFYWCYYEWYIYVNVTSRIPGPPSLLFLGNMLQAPKNARDILTKMFDWWRIYGKKNYRFKVAYASNIFITEAKDVEFILSSTEILTKGDIYDMLHPWLGRGLLTSYGTHWSKHRKMITPSFHFNILQNFHDVMNSNSSNFIEKLRKDHTDGKIFDIQTLSSHFTLDVICETAMGVKVNAVDNPNSTLVTAFQDMCENINMRIFRPFQRKLAMYQFYRKDYTKYLKTLKTLQDFANEVIDKRIESMQNEKTKPKTEDNEFVRKKQAFLDTLLTSTIDGKPLTRRSISDEVSTFIFEGFDTTTSAVSFAIYLLSRHPDIQRRVFEEQQKVMGEDLQRSATFQEINEMKYLDLVIKEVERLYPSVPVISRKADKDYDMNGTFVPKGINLTLFIMSMGYNEETFVDPYRVNPDRFNVARSNKNIHPYAYIPFSAGPRNCIGQKFALLELKTVISKLVRAFEILPPLDELVSKGGYVQHFFGLSEEDAKQRYTPHKYDPVFAAVLTLKSDNGVLIRLKERK